MDAEPNVKKDEEALAAEMLATSMQDQLRKEVASWSEERSHSQAFTRANASSPRSLSLPGFGTASASASNCQTLGHAVFNR